MRKIFSFLTAILFAGSMMATDYELVTSASQLQAGAKYVIGTATGKFMSTTSNASNRRITDGTITENVVEGTETMMVFTLGGEANAWTFATDNYLGTAGYLNATNSTGSNYLKVVAELDDYAYFTIDIADGVTTVTCNGKTSRNILYLNGTTCFACYNTQSSAQYIKPNLYKEVSDTPTAKYYMKNNWDAAADWSWKEMTQDGSNYKLENVVFGGSGVNYNTAMDDTGATWVPADKIAGDKIAAKDTVNFVLNPTAGTVTATLVGKYVDPEGTKYYMKNCWNAAEWSWKVMTQDGNNWKLENVVYGGTGVNYNTAMDDTGATWVPEASIAGDKIAAKDTVNLVLNPTAGTVTATLVGKYNPDVPPVQTLPVVALAGTMNGWSTTANVLVAAEDSLSASVKIALEAGRDTFKIVSDGKWLSLNGEGESLYAFHRDWTSASHINGIDLRNFELTADVAGEYTFTWTYADSTLTITFPAKPQPVDDKIIFEWTKGTGAKVEADKTDLNANNMGTMTIGTFVQARLLGTNAMDNNAKGYKMGNNDVCVEIQGTKAFAVGDTVIITGVCGGSGARAFAIAPNTTINAAVDTALTNTQENTSDILEYKVIVKEAQAGDTMRIFRQAGKSMYLYSIKVVRPSATPEPPTPATLPVVALAGTMNGWSTTANVLVAAEDSLSASVKIALEAGRDTFKIVSDGKWLSLNGEGESLYAFHRDWTSASHINGIDLRNFELTADVAGEYTFTWTYADSTLTITFPEPVPVDPTVAVKGSMNNWGDSIPFVLAQDKKSASLTANIKKGTYEFKMIINGDWRSNGYEFHRGFPGCAGITGNTDANMTVVIDVEGAYTFKWYFANDSLAIIYPEKPEPAFKDGFYLVGKFGGVDAWGIDANKIFTSNPSAEGEYMLENVTLAEGDLFKVVRVEEDAIKTWFPDGIDTDYVVDAAHAGVKTIYFRADGQGGEGWHAGCIFVTPNEMTAITNVNADAKAVKSLKNGILMIEKDGKVYNVIGLQIR